MKENIKYLCFVKLRNGEIIPFSSATEETFPRVKAIFEKQNKQAKNKSKLIVEEV
jgi:hypothetical protein